MIAQSGATLSGTIGGKDRLLRRALVGNALFSIVSGLAMVAGSGWLSEFTGLTPGWIPAAIGVGVLLWAVDVGWLARKDELEPSKARMVIAGDLAWVVVSYGILITGVPELTTAGAWTVAILAEIVGMFAVAQYVGLRRMRS